ncbi:MAG: cytochrome c maturation protein CcmE [Firmicutes bacterium]|nr:cytochrome c maturation protein CcmE [Bacillota bacterium]
MKRYDKIVLVLLFVVFTAGVIITARGAMSTYVTFAEARRSGRPAQVKGLAVAGTAEEIDSNAFSFHMQDENGEIVPVVARVKMPANLFAAESVVVTGRFEGDVFAASKILVKCPSKYEAEHPASVKKE